MDRCSYIRVGNKKHPLTPRIKQQILDLVKTYGTGLFDVLLTHGDIKGTWVFGVPFPLEMMFSVFHLRNFPRLHNFITDSVDCHQNWFFSFSSYKGLMLEMSVFASFTVANLPYQLSG